MHWNRGCPPFQAASFQPSMPVAIKSIKSVKIWEVLLFCAQHSQLKNHDINRIRWKCPSVSMSLYVTPLSLIPSVMCHPTMQHFSSFLSFQSPTDTFWSMYVYNVDCIFPPCVAVTLFGRRWRCLSLQVSGKLWWILWVQLHCVQGAQTGDHGRQSPDNVSDPDMAGKCLPLCAAQSNAEAACGCTAPKSWKLHTVYQTVFTMYRSVVDSRGKEKALFFAVIISVFWCLIFIESWI